MRRAGPEPRSVRLGLRIGTGLALVFLFVPLLVIVLYAFNKSIAQSWPISKFSTKWFSVAWHNPMSDLRFGRL
jgi:putative spermidine/putrescine transport system permease protein